MINVGPFRRAAARGARFVPAILAALLAPSTPGRADSPEFTGSISAEARLFGYDAVNPGQRRHTGSLFGEVEYRQEWDAVGRVTIRPFLRLDSADRRRTHFDLREASWFRAFRDTAVGDFDLEVGVGKVFWGVTESRHLVDIINQTDLIEYPDEEEKLGQPMIHLAIPRDWGVVELFVLPGFRTRTFPGRNGRLRSALVVDTGDPVFESGARRAHVDFATRYSNAVGPVDFGFAWFHGTTREPAFLLGADSGGRPVLIPFYQQIDQFSLDAQLTTGPWLLKLEALYRRGQNDRQGREDAYFASVSGFEYTFFGILGTGMDLGVLSEWHYDDRGARALTPFDNDLFVGLRWTANDPQDSTILAGIIQDIGSPARFFFLEASRRIGESWTLAIEGALFAGQSSSELLFAERRDDYIQITWTYNF